MLQKLKSVPDRLWLKIWLSVVLVVITMTLLASLTSRLLSDPPIREVVARNAMGTVVAHGRALLVPPMVCLRAGANPARAWKT